jgi:Type II CAAX prenyl endopeptidase Rce1-like
LIADAPQRGSTSSARSAFLSLFLLLLSLTVALIVISFPAGVYAFFSGRLSTTYTPANLITPYFWIGPLVGFFPFHVGAGAWFAFLIAVYGGFLAYALLQKPSPLKAAGAAFRTSFGALTSSPFLAAVISIAFLTFTATIIDALVIALGFPIGSVGGDPFELFLGFTTAPLVEEFGFRVMLIGVVALILSLGRPWKSAVGSLWRPSRALEGAAVGSGTSIIIWLAVGLSSVTFGACHVVCGTGSWDVGKFPEAAYGGFVLGYLYVRYGFHVAVIAHWGVDYFGSALAFFGQAFYGIPWNGGTTEFVGQYLVDFDMLFLFGLASFIVVTYLGVLKLVKRKAPETVDFDKPPADRVAAGI